MFSLDPSLFLLIDNERTASNVAVTALPTITTMSTIIAHPGASSSTLFIGSVSLSLNPSVFGFVAAAKRRQWPAKRAMASSSAALSLSSSVVSRGSGNRKGSPFSCVFRERKGPQPFFDFFFSFSLFWSNLLLQVIAQSYSINRPQC